MKIYNIPAEVEKPGAAQNPDSIMAWARELRAPYWQGRQRQIN